MDNIFLQIDDQGNGLVFCENEIIGSINWSMEQSTYLFTPTYNFRLNCDELAELAEKIGKANRLSFPNEI